MIFLLVKMKEHSTRTQLLIVDKSVTTKHIVCNSRMFFWERYIRELIICYNWLSRKFSVLKVQTDKNMIKKKISCAFRLIYMISKEMKSSYILSLKVIVTISMSADICRSIAVTGFRSDSKTIHSQDKLCLKIRNV